MKGLTFEVIDNSIVVGDSTTPAPPVTTTCSGSYYIDGSDPNQYEYIIPHNCLTANLDVTIKDDNGDLIYAPVAITDSTITVTLNPVVACTVYWEANNG